MIQVQLKLRMTRTQERQCARWLWHLSGVYNWTVRKLDLDARDRRFHSRIDIQNMLIGHSRRMGIPSHVIRGTAWTALNAWDRSRQGLSSKPRLKSARNRLNNIPFPDPIDRPTGRRIAMLGIGRVRFHAQEIPDGRIKLARLVRRASGWYLCLFVDAATRTVPVVGHGEVGIDPGFTSLVTLSTGEKVEHPRELTATAARLSQAQRGGRARLTARLKEREANQRKDRNHKLSRRLVAENELIAWSKDSHQQIARKFGKSVASAAHGQLRQMIDYKSRAGGRRFVAVPSRNSTKTCSACGARSGPAGYAGLSVRRWRCGCGADHDRDCNAAMNTLIAARGMRVESAGDGLSGIAI